MLKLVIIVSSVCFASVALAAPQSTQIKIDTMACGPDPHVIKDSLSAIKGVDQVIVSLEQKSVTVSFDNSQTNLDALMAAIATTGHASLLVPPNH